MEVGARRDRAPGWRHERRLERLGCGLVAGLDEVGRGSLAGPVVAAAVVLRPGEMTDEVRDSKLLTPTRRAGLLRVILRRARMWSIGAASAEEIDRVNVLEATRRAMARAVDALPRRPEHLLIDALRLPACDVSQTSIVGGDRTCVSIAAASIVAKVVRDRIMDEFDRAYPGFGFAAHKGYGTRAHLAAITRDGACPIHRRTFRGIWREGLLPFTDAAASTNA